MHKLAGCYVFFVHISDFFLFYVSFCLLFRICLQPAGLKRAGSPSEVENPNKKPRVDNVSEKSFGNYLFFLF